MSRYTFLYKSEEDWPPLAWLACCVPGENNICVRHGADVEAHTDWYCEAAWDGLFAEGNFDQTDIVVGSGARLRNKELTFVSSGSISDRLHYIQFDQQYWISNSLVCLAAVLDLQIDPWYPWYYEDLSSICNGIDAYKQTLTTDKGEVDFCYYRNLVWNGRQLTSRDKPAPERVVSDYRSYREFMTTTLQGLARNLGDPLRRLTYSSISTCSSGYDSLAATILAQAMGNREVISVSTDRLGLGDDGADLVKSMGFAPIKLERHAWRETDFIEATFIAADGCGRDVWVSAAGAHLHHRLILLGHLGGSMWDTRPLMDKHFRQDPAQGATTPPGTSFGEYRLQVGCLVCLVPSLGIGNLDQIRSLSNSEEMAPWRLGQGYDRPLPRRIIEEAGIERERFAQRKTATAVHLFRRKDFDRFFDGQPSWRDFMRWLRRTSRQQPPPQDAPELTSPARERIEVPMFRHLFPWALEWCKGRYV